MPEHGDKPAGQMHMTKTPKKFKARKGGGHSRTMGTGKVAPKAKGAMGKNQATGDGGASNF